LVDVAKTGSQRRYSGSVTTTTVGADMSTILVQDSVGTAKY
jgi:hypothetical protein